MTGGEIIFLIVMFFVFTSNFILYAKHAVSTKSTKSIKMDAFLNTIKTIINDDLHGRIKTADDIKKIQNKKKRLLYKMNLIILKISECSDIDLHEIELLDDIENKNIIVSGFESDSIRSTSYFGDYLFVFAIVRGIITTSTFPDKDSLLKLNKIYKRYDVLSSGKIDD